MIYPSKVLFLDMDGVMCTDRRAAALERAGLPSHRGVDEWRASMRTSPLPWAVLDPLAVEQLNRVLAATGAAIVVSSDWRWRGRYEMEHILRDAGVRPAETEHGWFVLDVTPIRTVGMWTDRGYRATGGRGQEIGAWLSDPLSVTSSAVTRFAILDDVSDMAWLASDFFMCDGRAGLTEDVADLVIEHLTAPEVADADA